MVNTNDISPVKTSERFIILDALRGFALLGICMANFPEFSLYTFLSPEAAASMPTAVQDKITRYLLYILLMASSTRCSLCCSASASPSLSAMRNERG